MISIQSDLDIPPIAEEAEAKSFPSTKKKTAGSARDNPDEKVPLSKQPQRGIRGEGGERVTGEKRMKGKRE
eukprot:1316971-Amorphochlora_amoeboformis.AAC.1